MEPSSQSTLLTKKQVEKETERLTTELQLMTSQRNELRDRLLFISEGTVDNRPYHKPNPFYEKLKLEHKQVMLELKIFKHENTEASEKLSELTKETVFYRGLQSRLLMEQTQLKSKVDMLRQEKKKLQEDWVLLKHHLEDLNLICKNQDEDTSDMKIQKQQERKSLEERLEVLLKQKEMVIQTKDLAENLQHHFDVSQMRPYHKPNPFYEKLKLEHKQIMWELKIFENENTEASEKFRELTKETVFCHQIALICIAIQDEIGEICSNPDNK
ncbi:Disks large-like 5 [Cricetulus griseus]|uniref:Disks large-like 5 n=1 Tax=Cricetulus griseus TaxID=10029 RepID=G3ICQ0_CRIGR|nr:Disks large-like 5 [Cricetulus griseus]